MARPKSADPEQTKHRVLAAARAIAIKDGIASVTARPVAQAAAVSATTVCDVFSSIEGLQRALMNEVFMPLLSACDLVGRQRSARSFDVAIAPLLADRNLALLAVQASGYAGRLFGTNRGLAVQFAKQWTIVREHLAESNNAIHLRYQGRTPAQAADRLISLYFAAALHLARDQNLSKDEIRTLLT